MAEISLETAIDIAGQLVEQLASAAGDTYELLSEETRDIGRGWLFFFNSADFVRSRNPVDSLAGNGPLLVLRDGQVHQLPSSIPWEEALSQYR
jgi:hypothetical protein